MALQKDLQMAQGATDVLDKNDHAELKNVRLVSHFDEFNNEIGTIVHRNEGEFRDSNIHPDGISGYQGLRTIHRNRQVDVHYYFNGCSITWGDELEQPDIEAYPYHIMHAVHKILQGEVNDTAVRSNLLNESLRGGSNDRIVRTSTQTLYSCGINQRYFSNDLHPLKSLPRWGEEGHVWPPKVAIIQWTYPMRFECWNDTKERYAAIAPQMLNVENQQRAENAMGRFTEKETDRICRAMIDTGSFSIEFQLQKMFTQMVHLKNTYKAMNVPYMFIAFPDERVIKHINRYEKSCYNVAERNALEMYYLLKEDPWCLMDVEDGIFNFLTTNNDCGVHIGGHPNKHVHKIYAEHLLKRMNDNGVIKAIKQNGI